MTQQKLDAEYLASILTAKGMTRDDLAVCFEMERMMFAVGPWQGRFSAACVTSRTKVSPSGEESATSWRRSESAQRTVAPT